MKEDKDWATLVHKDGHEIRIAKAPLSHLQRKQLEALPTRGVKHYDEGGDVASDDSSSSDDSPSSSNSTPPLDIEPVNSGSDSSNQAPAPQTQGSPFQSQFQAQVPGYEEEKNANLALAQAQRDQGTQESQAIQDYSKSLGALPTQQQVVSANKESSDKLLSAYQQQKLDPDKYWDNHSKIAAGIGILLSGFGQAIGGGNIKSNLALDTLHSQINQDIERQKNEQGKKLNLWQMNRQALGNDLAANLATQNQLLTGLKYKIAKSASESRAPIALANAQIANAKIDQSLGMNSFKLSLLNPTSDNPDPASRIQFLVPPDRQQKVVDEVNAAKNTVANSSGIFDAFDQAAKEVRPLSGGVQTSGTAFVPGLKSPGQQALQARLGPTFQDVEGTVRQAAMDNLDHNITPKFGDDDSTIATKRQSLVDYLRSKSAAGASKSFGIDLTKFPATNTLAIGQAGGPGGAGKAQINPNAKYERQIINGKAYMVPVQGQR